MNNTLYSDRKHTIIFIFIFAVAIFVIRLFYIQVLTDEYKISANNNVLRFQTEYPNRGLIYDRKGKLLVYNEASYDLMVTPRYAKNIDTNELCKILNIDKVAFIERIGKAKAFSSFRASIFDKQVSTEMYGMLQEKMYKLPGFFIQARTLRKYPKPIAAHILGYIGEVDPSFLEKNKYYRAGDYAGISGIEESYEKFLRGKRGLRIVMVDALNREKGSFREGRYDTTAVAGEDIFSTIDGALQEYGEKLMQNKKGSIVAIDPATGEILALVTSPTYDPNLLVGNLRAKNFNQLNTDELKPLFNRALLAQYPPGSTFKILNALIGQQEKVLFPDTRYSCSEGYHIGSLTVGCHRHSSPLDLKQSIQYSCNAYYCNVFRSILDRVKHHDIRESYTNWRNHVLSFGFGNKLGSDLYESKGIIPTSKYYDKYHNNHWNSVSVISLAIGQGETSVTPMQLANFTAILANRGFYYTPHIIKAIGKNKFIDKKFTEIHYTSVEPKYFDVIIEAMYDVVESGTGVTAKIKGIPMCGKTGTAQNPHGEDHSVFILFAPKDNPKIALAIIVENAGFGATWAAPIASLMVEKYLTNTIKRPDLEKQMLETNLMNVIPKPKKKKIKQNE
ncbi:MAG: penicillin-binding protein 2 [Bacteroidales bacterium]